MRVVIYARFSTENQNASSIEDQARVCRTKAAALGLTVDAAHADSAVSGGVPLRARSGGAALMADRFDVLIVESLSRLSRDTVDGEMEMRRLEHRGVRIIGVSDGYDSEQVGHQLEICEQQAQTVREIFARYGAGESCQRIAADLNARGIAGPRGGTWCVSALYGSPAKGSGILNNEIYIGRYVWNRSRWVRNPDSRKRERLLRPQAEWKVDERLELRIIDEAMWHAVRTRMNRARAEGGRAGRGGVPTTLLGGILRCGLCGGAVLKISATSYGCAARRDRGPAVCMGVGAATKRVDDGLVGHVRKHLESPVILAQLEREAALLVADRGTRDGNRRELGQRVRDLDAEARRLADAIAAVGNSPTLTGRLRELEAEIDRAKRAQAVAPVATLSSTVRESVRALLRDLGGALNAELPVARDALRAALGDVRLQPEGDGVYAVFEDTADRLLLRAVGDGMGRVAGTRNLTELRALDGSA